ncbi:SAM-dependent methyltransferase [Microtetraspora niveoalba]|uniref:SAM-dependent methyltransferase n=1 Tax=Microtetraspora niveoalba TaxID=46175 RepID=UPI000AE39EBF|nr:methyltransferase domain-containing protein [Microtetraspora niveoalba]
MSLRFHEIAEARNRILNPLTEDRLALLAEICGVSPGVRQLDLACGKGEMLCRWAAEHGAEGIGVDISEVFLAAAAERARELGVTGRVRFERGDAGAHTVEPGGFDIVSCIGATWIGGGLAGTLALMRPGLRDGGLLLVGEPYWVSAPPPEACEALQVEADAFGTLIETLDRFEAAGMELIEMVLADHDSWDRYMAPQWWALGDWLRANPEDPEVEEVRAFLERSRRSHLEYGRRYLGWGVFVVRPR